MGRPTDPNGAQAIVEEIFGERRDCKQVERAKYLLKKLADHPRASDVLIKSDTPLHRSGSNKSTKQKLLITPAYRTLVKNLILVDSFLHDHRRAIDLVVGGASGPAVDKLLETAFRDATSRFRTYRTWLNLIDPLREKLAANSIDWHKDYLRDVITPGHRNPQIDQDSEGLPEVVRKMEAFGRIEALESDTRIDRSNPDTLARVADEQLRIGNLVVAESWAQEAVSVSPDLGLAWQVLARVELLRARTADQEQLTHYVLADGVTQPMSAEEHCREEAMFDAADRADNHRSRALHRLLRAYHLWPDGGYAPSDLASRREVAAQALLTAFSIEASQAFFFVTPNRKAPNQDLLSLCADVANNPDKFWSSDQFQPLALQVAAAELPRCFTGESASEAYRTCWKNLEHLYQDCPDMLLILLSRSSSSAELLLRSHRLNAKETIEKLNQLKNAARHRVGLRTADRALGALGQEAQWLFRNGQQFPPDKAGDSFGIDTGETSLPPAERRYPALHDTVERALKLIDQTPLDDKSWLRERTAWRYRRMAAVYWHAYALQESDAPQAQRRVTGYLQSYGHELEDLLPRIGTYIARASCDGCLDEDPFGWCGDLLDIDPKTKDRPFAALLLELFPNQENDDAHRWAQRINAQPVSVNS